MALYCRLSFWFFLWFDFVCRDLVDAFWLLCRKAHRRRTTVFLYQICGIQIQIWYLMDIRWFIFECVAGISSDICCWYWVNNHFWFSFVLILILKPLSWTHRWLIGRFPESTHTHRHNIRIRFVADTRHRNRIQFKRVFVFRTGRRLTVGVFSYRWSSMIIFFDFFRMVFLVHCHFFRFCLVVTYRTRRTSFTCFRFFDLFCSFFWMRIWMSRSCGSRADVQLFKGQAGNMYINGVREISKS